MNHKNSIAAMVLADVCVTERNQTPDGYQYTTFAYDQISGNYIEGTGYCTPEPASLTLLGIGAFGLLGYVWRRRNSLKVE